MRRLSIPGGLIAAQAPLIPPEFANLQHWIDVTDPATVFSDDACTVQAGNNDIIECLANKGFSTDHPVMDFTINNLILSTGVLNGLQVLTGDAGSNAIVSGGGTETNGASGHTIAMVARATSLVSNFAVWEWSSGLNISGGSAWNTRAVGLIAESTGKAVVDDEWVYVYGSFANNDNNHRAAGVAESNYTGAYTQLTGSTGLGLTLLNSDFAEGLMWNIAFNSTQRTALVAYFDAKYGTLPIIT